MDASVTSPERNWAPLSTYRLQLNAGFRFVDSAAIVEYLAALGIGAIYTSPYFRARAGSMHGYDVIDHNALNPEIGTPEEHRRLILAMQERGIAHILDFVPNHMGIGGVQNPWWTDVMQWGEASPYAKYFDIDWHPPRSDLEGKVLLPFLGDHYGSAIERGDITPVFDPQLGTFGVAYFDRLYPLAPSSYAPLLRRAAEIAEPGLSRPLGVLAASFEGVEHGAGARETFEHLCDRVKTLAASAEGLAAIRRALDDWHPIEGNGAAADRLDALLDRQHYRLSSWRVSLSEINYRRFFDINDLAGLRVEDAEVLAQTHRLAFEMLADGRLQGLRIDHVDGLFDPAAYCRLLHDRAALLGYRQYLVVEKVLARFEQLRDAWNVDGTTGYDFMNAVNALFVDSRAEFAFDRIYRDFAAIAQPFDEIAYEAKHHVMRTQLASELSVLANLFYRVARTDRRSSDYTYDGLREAVAEVIASFPVYRTYVTSESVAEEDRHFIEWAVVVARKRSTVLDDPIFDFIRDVLTASVTSLPNARYDRTEVLHLAMKFQQFTPPVMAKAVEDTAFYRYVRLLSLNEVGGDPQRFGTTVAAFHRFNQNAAKRHPHGMLATATHDHKRGEDARLRIDALSEMPGRWRRALRAFGRLVKKSTYVDSAAAPSANDRYALYQTLLGTWPAAWEDSPPADELSAYLDRVEQWFGKAMREAKTHSSWANPNLAYEEGAVNYLRRLFDTGTLPIFMRDFAPLARDLALVGMVSSLAQTTLKLTSPGVPDLYQGCELWDLSLVDPDNRRPVDFDLRARVLTEMQERAERGGRLDLAKDLLREWRDGRIKFFAIWQLLQLRKRRAKTFLGRDYRHLGCGGPYRDRIVAFTRDRLVVAVPRLVYRILRTSDDGLPALGFTAEYISLPQKFPRRFVNVLTGEPVDALAGASRTRLIAADLFRTLPVAVLEPVE